MSMHCAASGDPDGNFDGYPALVDVSLDKAVREPDDCIYAVTCRLDSFEHATCSD